MTLTAAPIRLLLAAALAFALAAAAFTAIRGGAPAARPASPALGQLRPPAAAGQLEALQADVRAGRPGARAALASAYLQESRATGDPSYYAKAEALLREALRRDPRDDAALIELGALAASRHDFGRALQLARRARALAPSSLAVHPVLIDALVELGRYRAAERAAQAFVDLKPSLPSYARVSYLRELRGDLAGAAAAMRLAVAAGAAAPEDAAAAQILLGDLELARGRLGAAAREYAIARAGAPRYVPALAARARLRAARGDVPGAIAAMRRVTTLLPLPEHVIALGELQLAAGRRAAARETFALVAAERALLAGAGVDSDAELALFEADHGDPRRGVALARRAWAAAPGIRSADALGWALTRSGRPRAGLAWARRALRLGSLDPVLRFHAGATAVAAGRRAGGVRHLRLALDHGLRARPWLAARAERMIGGRR